MKLTIISGRSGSGKSTVLHILEDRGYYCIDNLPASLLPSLAKRLTDDQGGPPNIAVSIDARNISADLQQVPAIVNDLRAQNLPTEIIFLDANSYTLLKRFSESRRKHPLSSEKVGLREAIDRESELLEAISVMANLSIDTSTMSLQQLRDIIKKRLVDKKESGLALSFQSFGYKNGVPIDADFVYDIRCLPNPYWEATLRELTGNDRPVIEYLEQQSEVREMYEEIAHFLQKWLPTFREQQSKLHHGGNRLYWWSASFCILE